MAKWIVMYNWEEGFYDWDVMYTRGNKKTALKKAKQKYGKLITTKNKKITIREFDSEID